MVTNLASHYTDTTASTSAAGKNTLLVNFIRSLDIEILGQSVHRGEFITGLKDFMLPNFLLIYFLKGSGVLTSAGKSIRLTPGSLCLLEPFALYDGQRLSAEPMDYLYIYFDLRPVSLRGVFQKIAAQADVGLVQRKWHQQVNLILQSLSQEQEADSFKQIFLLQHTIRNVIAYILYEQMQARDTSFLLLENMRVGNLVNQAFAYTEQHFAEPLDIGKLVHAIGTSRSSLGRIFVEIFQCPPDKALTRFKMRRALELMKNGASVKQAARELGYSSSFHFSRTFKAVMHKSPTAYLKT